MSTIINHITSQSGYRRFGIGLQRWASCKTAGLTGYFWRERPESELAGGHFWHDLCVETLNTPAMTNDSTPYRIMNLWNVVQHELLPELEARWGALTPKLERLIHILDWIRIEEFVKDSWCGTGCPPHERAWLANAFVAKTVLNLPTTVALIDRLTVDRILRRICGFPACKKLPSEATFSRAFDEFAESRLAERVHEALVTEHLVDELIGHISRDGTAIPAREQPAVPAVKPMAATSPQPVVPRKRVRPRRGEERQPAAKASPLARQRNQTLAPDDPGNSHRLRSGYEV